MLVAGVLTACNSQKQPQTEENMTTKLTLTQEWDKVFPKSDKVDHKKVTFHNRYGIELAADMYIPKTDNTDTTAKFAAIAVTGPFGAVKEQSSGLYAQHMAERGFLTIAFDPSFTGESSWPQSTSSQCRTMSMLSASVSSASAALVAWPSMLPPSIRASRQPLPPRCTTCRR